MESSLILGRCREAHPGFSTTAWEIEAKLVLATVEGRFDHNRAAMS
jgi:hypothetical protein